ncbi:RNA polymerase sigma factor [bacterium]|nr:RNA polymerase sigma factor [bacterium]
MGKQSEFSKIYDKYINKIYRFIFLKVNSVEIAEDLTSETFLRGWRYFENGKEIDNFQAFLYRIARNLIVDFYRNKEKIKIVSAENSGPLPDPRPDPEEKAKNDSDILLIRQALAELKEDYQNMIILHYIEDLPIQDIAQIIGRSEGNTRVMLHRALKALKKQLQKTTLV